MRARPSRHDMAKAAAAPGWSISRQDVRHRVQAPPLVGQTVQQPILRISAPPDQPHLLPRHRSADIPRTCDPKQASRYRTTVRLRRTSRHLQDVGAFRSARPCSAHHYQGPRWRHRFTAHRAQSAQTVNCGRDSICDSAADGTFHVTQPPMLDTCGSMPSSRGG